jgi:UDP-N-acetylmuramoylalanine--D-glutamate ligase
MISNEGAEKLMSTSEVSLIGMHNLENVMASALVGYIWGIPLDSIKSSVKNFQGLEHRQEKVLTLKGISFFNDSKATNVDATLKSIQSFDKKIILILGGRDKGGNFHLLKDEVKQRVKRIILIGEASDKIKHALQGSAPMDEALNMQEAVKLGYSLAQPEEIVLLAPACTSFDMYRSFAHRGQVFKQEVHSLAKKENTK